MHKKKYFALAANKNTYTKNQWIHSTQTEGKKPRMNRPNRRTDSSVEYEISQCSETCSILNRKRLQQLRRYKWINKRRDEFDQIYSANIIVIIAKINNDSLYGGKSERAIFYLKSGDEEKGIGMKWGGERNRERVNDLMLLRLNLSRRDRVQYLSPRVEIKWTSNSKWNLLMIDRSLSLSLRRRKCSVWKIVDEDIILAGRFIWNIYQFRQFTSLNLWFHWTTSIVF